MADSLCNILYSMSFMFTAKTVVFEPQKVIVEVCWNLDETLSKHYNNPAKTGILSTTSILHKPENRLILGYINISQ